MAQKGVEQATIGLILMVALAEGIGAATADQALSYVKINPA